MALCFVFWTRGKKGKNVDLGYLDDFFFRDSYCVTFWRRRVYFVSCILKKEDSVGIKKKPPITSRSNIIAQGPLNSIVLKDKYFFLFFGRCTRQRQGEENGVSGVVFDTFSSDIFRVDRNISDPDWIRKILDRLPLILCISYWWTWTVTSFTPPLEHLNSLPFGFFRVWEGFFTLFFFGIVWKTSLLLFVVITEGQKGLWIRVVTCQLHK